jgi:hypothetical protein
VVEETPFLDEAHFHSRPHAAFAKWISIRIANAKYASRTMFRIVVPLW